VSDRQKPTWYYEALLFITTVTWSMSFVWSKIITNTGMVSEMYLFLRYTLAALLLLPFAWKKLRACTRAQVRSGVIMGLIIFVGMMFQVAGIAMTTPSNSSFITTAYVVIAPFTTWLLLRQKPDRITYVAVLLCLVGIYILNMKPGEMLSLNLGNALTLVGALCWAFQLTYTSMIGGTMDPLALSALSFGTTGLGGLVYCLIGGAMFRTPVAQLQAAAPAILLTALLPTILAGVVQVYAQPHVNANKAAVLYTMEAVFATLISIFLGLEGWSLSVLTGGGVIIAAVLLMQFGGKKRNV